jgi:hypothetical protein
LAVAIRCAAATARTSLGETLQDLFVRAILMMVIRDGLMFCNQLRLAKSCPGRASVDLKDHHFHFAILDVVLPASSALRPQSSPVRAGADVE